MAVEKLEEIADHISLDKPTVALKRAESIQDSVNKLIRFPRIGRQVPEIKRADIKELIESDYRIIYRLEPKRIFILTIRHSKQLLNKTDISNQGKKTLT